MQVILLFKVEKSPTIVAQFKLDAVSLALPHSESEVVFKDSHYQSIEQLQWQIRLSRSPGMYEPAEVLEINLLGRARREKFQQMATIEANTPLLVLPKPNDEIVMVTPQAENTGICTRSIWQFNPVPNPQNLALLPEEVEIFVFYQPSTSKHKNDRSQ